LEKRRKEGIEKARKEPPSRCQCGGEFKTNGSDYLCKSCNHKYEFDENLAEWVFVE
jgi:tRNA(Ile2) C34 agmatinyltransferase TiaS